MQGGAHAQFAAAPLNLGTPATYIVTGFWSGRAADEAEKQGDVHRASGATEDGTALLAPAEWDIAPGSKYVHICASETIDGLEVYRVANFLFPSQSISDTFTDIYITDIYIYIYITVSIEYILLESLE